MKRTTLGLALFIFAPSLTLHSQESQADYNWEHPEEVHVTDREMAFTSESIGPTKNESIFVWVYGDDGSVLLFSLFHVDSFLLDRWGMYALVVDPEGNDHWFTSTPKGRSVSFVEDRLSVTVDKTHFEGRNGVYQFECNFSGLECSIQIQNRILAWSPGRLDYTEDGSLYQIRILVSPWASATGTVSVNGTSFNINGHGYVSKTRFANPLTRFAPYIHSLKSYSDEYFLYLLDVTLNSAYDSKIVPMLIFAQDERWLFTSRDYDIRIEEYTEIEGAPYPYPSRIRIKYEGDEYSLEGVYREERFLNVTDIFKELPAIVRRALLLFISRPIYFRAAGSFEGTLTRPDGTTTSILLDGPYEYTVVR